MLGCALLPLLLLLRGSLSQGCPCSMDPVLVLSGDPLSLRPPNRHMEVAKAEWKMNLTLQRKTFLILNWKNDSRLNYSYFAWQYSNFALDHFNHSLHFKGADLTLVINVTKPQDSGVYWLEVTEQSGKVCKTEFNVSVIGHVGKPDLQGRGQALDKGKCHVALSCRVSGDSNVSYAWYRGSTLIQEARGLAELEEQSGGPHVYTCNVSNPVSWASLTLNLTQDCAPATVSSVLLPFLVAIIILVPLLLSTLTCFSVWKRKRQKIQTSSTDFLTIYEDVKDRKDEEQKSTGQGSTIYSMILLQSPAPASQEAANTVYSSLQPHQKFGSKKRNHNPPLACTIYEEVGKRQYKDCNPARLSRKELENFDIYS